MSVEKKVSYLLGLAEGLNISKDTAEGKLLLAIIDTLEEISDEFEEVNEELDALNEYIEEVDDGLMELEEDFYDDDDDCGCGCGCDDDCDCDCDDDCDCGCCDCAGDEDLEDFEYDEYQCPKCKEFVCFSGEFADEELVCPICGANIKED